MIIKKRRYETALITAMGMILALLTLQPAPARAVDVRTPANASIVSTVPVLEWPAVANAASYELQVSTSATFSTTLVSERRSTPAYVFTEDVAPGTYHWRYRAFAADSSQLSLSPAWTFTRAAQPGPSLQAPADGAHLTYPTESPTLRWDPIASFGSYIVQWDDNPDFRSTSEATTTATAFTLPTLLPQDDNKTIYWRVRAVASSLDAVKTAWSQQRSFVVDWGVSGPTLVAPADSTSLDDAVDQAVYEWLPTPGAATYELQVGLDNRFTTLVHPDTGVDYPSGTGEPPFTTHATKFVAASRYPAKSHWWRVRAIDANGSPGPWSATWQFTRRWSAARPNNVTVDPTVPLNEFEVTWDAVPDTTYYEIELSSEPTFHTGGAKAVCTTPHNRFSPAYEGSYNDAKRETECPIRIPLGVGIPSGFALTPGLTVYIHVRAVHETLAGEFVYGPWSDQANGPGGTPPPPAQTTLSDDSAGGTPANEPANPVAPASDSTWTDWPTLRWEPAIDAEAYLVAIAKDREFTNSVLTDLDTNFRYYVTRGTSFVPQTTLAENNTDGSYFWYVLPCQTYVSTDVNTCAAPDRDAILQSGRWRSFHKLSNQLSDLNVTPSTDQPWVQLSWDDTFTSSPFPATLGTGGFKQFEVQITQGTWAQATTLLTETPTITTSEMDLEPSSVYRWRVRAIDGGLLPLPWSQGSDFTMASYPGPSGLTVVNDLTEQPCLTWDPAAHASGYLLEIYSGSDPSYPESARVMNRSTKYSSFCPTGLGGGTFSWRVRSEHSQAGMSQWSPLALATFTVSAEKPVLEGPASPTTPQNLLFRWAPVPFAASYTVELSTDHFWTVSTTGLSVTHAWTPPELTTGDYSWRVNALDGQGEVLSTSDAADLRVVDPLTLATVMPASGPLRGGTRVTLTGTGFQPSVSVTFDGMPGTALAYASKTLLTVTTPAHAAGPVDVTVSDTDGRSTTKTAGFTYLEAPTVTGVAPATGPAAGGTIVTITGTHFAPTATVRFGVDLASVTGRTADTGITVLTPAHSAGRVDVTVSNPDGQVSRAAEAFTFVASPSVTSVTPDSGSPVGGTVVRVQGNDFQPGAAVTFDGISAPVTDRQGTTGITVTTPVHAPGSVDVTVINPDGQTATAPSVFTYRAGPTISAVTPDSGPASGSTRVTITGANFDPEAAVTFGDQPLIVNERSDSSLTVTTLKHAPGPVDVIVSNSDGQISRAVKAFTFVNAPIITSVSPAGGVLTGDTVVTIQGKDFQPGASVTFGGNAALVTDRQGTTGITVTTPSHSPGAVDVTVTNPDGQTATLKSAFTYRAGPTINAVTPDSGPSSGYTKVSITGANFDPQAVVTFDDQEVPISGRTATLLTVTSPAHPAGPVDVIVTNPDGQRAIASDAFTYTLDTEAGTNESATPWFVAKPRLIKLGKRLRVRWSRPSSIGSPPDAYRVLMKTSAGASFQQVKATSRRRVDIRIKRATTYWVRIVAHSAAGWGAPGPVARRVVR